MFATVIGLFVPGCVSLENPAAFQIRDSGLHAALDISIYWVNDEEVLFAGPTGETRTRSDGVDSPINRVSVWNVRTNEVRRYAEISLQLCYHDGYVVFWQRGASSQHF